MKQQTGFTANSENMDFQRCRLQNINFINTLVIVVFFCVSLLFPATVFYHFRVRIVVHEQNTVARSGPTTPNIRKIKLTSSHIIIWLEVN